MARCKDCIHFCVCSPYTAPNESYPEVDGCKCFRAAADVVPKSEVEKLNNELVIWKQDRFNLYQRLELYETARQKVAREIFAEIERLITNECLVFKDENGIRGYVDASVHYAIAELKKKYTERSEE